MSASSLGSLLKATPRALASRRPLRNDVSPHCRPGTSYAARDFYNEPHPRATRDCTISPAEREREREREPSHPFPARALAKFRNQARRGAASTWPGCRVVFRTRRRSDPDFPPLGERRGERPRHVRRFRRRNSSRQRIPEVCALQTRRVKRLSGSRRVALSATREKKVQTRTEVAARCKTAAVVGEQSGATNPEWKEKSAVY